MEERQLHVLIIENDPQRIAQLQQAMTQTSFADQPVFANTFNEALQSYQSSLETQTSPLPDLIFINLSPSRSEAWTTLKTLKHDDRWGTVPVLALSDSDDQQLIRQAYQSGVTSYLVIPRNHTDWVPLLTNLGAYWRSVVRLPKTKPSF